MPILLTTPRNPGDLDSVAQYTHIELDDFWWSSERFIEFWMVHGTMSGNDFVKGKWEPEKHIIADNPKTGATAYTDIIQEATLDGELAIAAIGRLIYTYVLTNGIYVGTPVVVQV